MSKNKKAIELLKELIALVKIAKFIPKEEMTYRLKNILETLTGVTDGQED